MVTREWSRVMIEDNGEPTSRLIERADAASLQLDPGAQPPSSSSPMPRACSDAWQPSAAAVRPKPATGR